MKRFSNYLLSQLFIFSFTFAQSPISITRISDEINLDGEITEEVWKSIEPLPMTMHRPVHKGEMTQRTEIRLAYDGDFLYASAKCFDEPDMIKSTSYKRDDTGFESDWFSLQLDSFNDNENSLLFITFPTGARTDMTVFNDATPVSDGMAGFPFSSSWNTFWKVATTQNEEGWFVEMRIPFTSLRFQDVNGKVLMGLIITRRMARKEELHIYPDIPPNWGFLSVYKPSRAQKIIFEGIESKKPLYISPYITGGISQTPELNETQTAYHRQDDLEYGVGLDVKYGLTKNLTLDVTLNTDFAQVEADDQQVNLTRFSLFFPEKRQFFLERASIFDFNFGQLNRLFYSRRIGLEEGTRIPIIGGTRLVGRVGKWDMGLMNMQTASVNHIAPDDTLQQPSENMGVFRLRRQVINPYSYVGVIGTHRVGMGRFGENNPYNATYGVDGTIRVFGNEYLSFNWAQSFENGLENDPFSMDPARFRVSWEKRAFNGLIYGLTVARGGKNYRPGLGFELREDFTYIGDYIAYGFTPKASSRLRQHQFFLRPSFYFRNADGSLESSVTSALWEGVSKKGGFFNIGITHNYDDLRSSFELGDTEIPVGSYNFIQLNGMYWGPNTTNFRPVFMFQGGSYYGGNLISATFMPTWVISNYLQVQPFYQFSRAQFSDQNETFIAHLARLRFQYTANTKISLATFVQYNSVEHAVSSNIRFRLNPREGNDFYLVYNEDFNTSRKTEIPQLTLSSGRAILLKYVHTFVF